jgi:hypothetical protein
VLAVMFAEEPPSSSDPTKRLSRTISSVRDAFRRLLLQIGGASIAGAGRARQAPSSDCVLSDPRT